MKLHSRMILPCSKIKLHLLLWNGVCSSGRAPLFQFALPRHEPPFKSFGHRITATFFQLNFSHHRAIKEWCNWAIFKKYSIPYHNLFYFCKCTCILMSHVSCVMSPISCLLYHVSCLTYPVSGLQSHVFCLLTQVSIFIFLISYVS